MLANMKHDLIEQLEKLNPTEGEWKYSGGDIMCPSDILYLTFNSSNDDDTLVALAPTMRTAILEMAKEIEELRKLLKSDSAYTALRYCIKSPSFSGLDDCEDKSYIDLYNLVCELRKSTPQKP